jgi:4-hydroxythreonine-4-phosphate dehydrogenase
MKPVFAVTMGDPCGVGPEITLKAMSHYPDLHQQCRLIVLGNIDILKKTADCINLQVDIRSISEDEIANDVPNKIPCLDLNPIEFNHEYGKITAAGGKHSYSYIEKSIELAMRGKLNGVVTSPINKESLKAATIPFLDHTEMFTKLTQSKRSMTLFVTGDLRVFFYSRHISLAQVSSALDKDKLVETLSDCREYLEQIRISEPKIALAALNPHGGESGLFGTEEMEILTPAVEAAQKKGLDVVGPIPADSVFHLAKEGHYDAVLALYHDQGHIAAKTYDFHKTVSLTMGLPFLRTSVDHGTAYNIAGQGIASEISLVEAVKAAYCYYW